MKKISVILFALCILLNACKDKEEIGTLQLKLVPTYGDTVIDMNTAVQDENGLDLLILDGKFHMYLSNIKLINSNSTLPIEEVLLLDLLDPNLNPTSSKVPAGVYTSMEIGLGVDEKWNHEDPTSFDNDHPLGFDHNGNNWAWDPGYIFYIVEGSYSSTRDGNLDNTFSYHIGTDDLYKTVTLLKDITIEKDATQVIELRIDLKKILFDEGGMDLETENKSRSMGDTFVVAQKFVNLIAETIE